MSSYSNEEQTIRKIGQDWVLMLNQLLANISDLVRFDDYNNDSGCKRMLLSKLQQEAA